MDEYKSAYMLVKNFVKDDVNRLNSLFGRFRIFMPELISIMTEIKPLSRFILPIKYIEEFKIILDKLLLSYTVSNFYLKQHGRKEYLIKDDNYDFESFFYVYVYQDEPDNLNKIMNLDFKKNPLVGKYLGYPECCVKKYLKQHDQGVVNYYDISVIESKLSSFNDMRINYIFQDDNSFTSKKDISNLPLSIISHVPCSSHCEHSIALADQILEEIAEKYPSYVKFMTFVLSRPVCYRSIHDYLLLMNQFRFDSNVLLSKPLIGMSNVGSNFLKSFTEINALVIKHVGHRAIEIDGEDIRSKEVLMLEFN